LLHQHTRTVTKRALKDERLRLTVRALRYRHCGTMRRTDKTKTQRQEVIR
jgi:hypothetical protein